MINTAPPQMQNNRGDLTTTLGGQPYVLDISIVADHLASAQDDIGSMQANIKAREAHKIFKYRFLRPEYKFIPVVFGSNGQIGAGAMKFFSLMATDIRSLGRIPDWYFWSNIVTDFMTTIDRGAHETHLSFERKRLNAQNPASLRLFDRTTRMGLPSSGPRLAPGTRPRGRR